MTKKRYREREESAQGIEFGGIEFSTEPEITEYLVPTGLPGIYQSPVEPVDPYDCERWEESPYCGSNPLNRDFVDLSVDISVNPCEQCATFTPTLGYLSLPPYTICRRSNSPECALPPVPFPDLPREDIPPQEIVNPRRSCAEGTYLITVDYLDQTYTTRDLQRVFPAFVPQDAELGDALNIIYSQRNLYSIEEVRDRLILAEATLGEIIYDSGEYEYYQSNPRIVCHVYLLKNDGTKQHIKDVISPGFRNRSRDFEQLAYYSGGSFIVQYTTQVLWLDYDFIFNNVFPACSGLPNVAPTAPPYPLGENCEENCMACSGDSEELLRLIAKRLAVNDFPVSVPQSLLADRGNSTEEIQSVSQFIKWFVLQMDALIGQFPIAITIKDADATKEGDQKKEIKIPNLAEGIAELIGIGMNASINTDSLVNIGVRNLYETNLAKNAAIVAQDIARNNAEFLDYEVKEIDRKVPAAFTLGEIELDKILKESEHNIRTYDNVDKAQLKDYMTEFLQAVAIIRAAHWRKLDPNQPYTSQLKDILQRIVNVAGPGIGRDADGTVNPAPDADDFDQFADEVERGFTTRSGIEDAQNPYGRNYSQRPKIKQIGNTAD